VCPPSPTVRLPAASVQQYERFTLYDSPYPAHDRGHAIDLYPPGTGHDPGPAPAPVAGTVRAVREVAPPSRPWAAAAEYVIVVDLAAPTSLGAPSGGYARILHVDPAVAPGDEVAVGDTLGRTLRSGYFGRWVHNHLHVGVRPPDVDPFRATGSLPLAVDVPVVPVRWDGTGVVVESGPASARLQVPGDPDAGGAIGADRRPGPSDPGAVAFLAVGSDEGVPLDGGLGHYRRGGALDRAPGTAGPTRPLHLLGTRVGRARGRDVEWADVSVLANDDPVAGIALSARRADHGRGRDPDGGTGAVHVPRVELVAPDRSFALGERVQVRVVPTTTPVRLG
jgi:hypothetical protein